ncbi:hypothetical protein [Pseudoalteromonas maricaloris]|uniref:hypothetical protein n=1 Tax=Pseudoalteromonas maricaloris TaxID=184924 RepID=UPI00058024AB|nr:hypothetical protein [Pseudoalteromonas flavipulchra]KID36084.1 hypothetical protein QT15_10690 [Pseudoalteromonas flavipulchra NCIMB 2033 = ATCC BAA-314]MBD0780251.1 hypothetical protein [Pseudoalteromonas flavipulchra]MBE0371500.1 hypothetical protein [Pseudoalteromonas flavipulchra NCIMB 2033 = ATCC BAA-314]
MKIRKLPTDLEILGFIYKHYYYEFATYDENNKSRRCKVFVKVDCKLIGDHFGVDRDIIFGRLYYHLNSVYSYKKENGTSVDFYLNELKSVNFPYLASVLAELRQADRRFKFSLVVSIFAALIALTSLGMNFYKLGEQSTQIAPSKAKDVSKDVR